MLLSIVASVTLLVSLSLFLKSLLVASPMAMKDVVKVKAGIARLSSFFDDIEALRY